MKITIVGAGAIGGLLAFRLARAGHSVSIVARGAHLAAIHEQGLTMVDHLDGQRVETLKIPAAADPAVIAVQSGIQDVVIIGLKAHSIPAMLPLIAPLVGPETMVVPAINGLPWWYFQRTGGVDDGRAVRAVDPAGDMAQVLESGHIIGCVVHAAGEVRAPGVVHHTGGRRFIVGEIDRAIVDPLTPRVLALTEALNGADLDVVASADIRADVWAKLIGNLSFNPVAALSSSLMNQICDNEGLLNVIRPMLIEGMNVAAYYGVNINMTPDERIDMARHLGNAKISMHQDFESGRMPEIDAVVGAVIELADRAGISVPTIRMLDALVRARAIHLGLLPAVLPA